MLEPKELSKETLAHYERLAEEYSTGDIARLLAHISYLELHLSKIRSTYSSLCYASPEMEEDFLNRLLACARNITYPPVESL